MCVTEGVRSLGLIALSVSVCLVRSLRLNELQVGGGRFFIAILMDITDLREALEKSAAIFEKGLSPMLVMDSNGT